MKDISGYEGQYTISREGLVLSTPKDGKCNRTLKQEVMSSGSHTSYRRVTLSKDGKTKRFMVHRLVAQAFIANPNNKPQVNHIDNDGSNNKANNLEWVTGSENMLHCIKQGRHLVSTVPGGKAAGNIRKEKFLQLAKKEIGKVYGQLTIVKLLLNQGKANRTKFVCTCSCGSLGYTKRERSQLNSNKKLYCNECAQKLRRKNEV